MLKKELAAFIIDVAKTQNYDELTTSAIVDFVINILILPKNLEDNFVKHCYENYFQMDNTDIVTGRTIPLAEAFSKAFFKESYGTMLQRLREAQKEREGRIKAEKELKEAKLKEAKLKAAKEAKTKTDRLILKLYIEQKLSISIIANILEEKKSYVKTIIEQNKKEE